MQCFQGKSVYKGIVMGPVAVLRADGHPGSGEPDY